MITITSAGVTISESSTLRWVVEVLDDGTIVARWPGAIHVAPSTFNREDYLTTSEAAVDIGVSVKTIQNWRTWSGLPSITDPTDAKHKRVLIAKRDWEAFLDARRAAGRSVGDPKAGSGNLWEDDIAP